MVFGVHAGCHSGSGGGKPADQPGGPAALAQGYFLTASEEKDFPESQMEAEFGYLLFTAITMEYGKNFTAGGTLSRWQDLHSRLKAVRSSGLLDKKYEAKCVRAIDVVAENVERAREHKSWENSPIVLPSSLSSCFPAAPVSDSCSYSRERDDDALDAVARAMERTEKLGMDWKGWDPEAPTDSSEIW